MRLTGWIFMLTSLGFVWGLAGWCFLRVLRPERESGTGENRTRR